jgi:outer membrane murein-binding lipoprotein Lpp
VSLQSKLENDSSNLQDKLSFQQAQLEFQVQQTTQEYKAEMQRARTAEQHALVRLVW